MKKYISVFALSALVCSSCSDFLDVQPEGDATTTQYFTNDQQAIDAIDGLYERFHQEGCYGRELFWEQGAACDVVWGRTRGYSTLATLNYTGPVLVTTNAHDIIMSYHSSPHDICSCLIIVWIFDYFWSFIYHCKKNCFT